MRSGSAGERSVGTRIRRYARKCLRLKGYLNHPGDGRVRPQIGSGHLIWSLVIGYLLRESSFLAIESLARSSACRALGIGRRFSDDTLGYFTEKLNPEIHARRVDHSHQAGQAQ